MSWRFAKIWVKPFPGLPKALMAMWGDDRSQADKAYAEYDFTMMPFGRFAF